MADISMEYKDEPYRPENDSVENVLQATAAILKAAKVSKSVNEDVSDFEINDGVDEVVILISAFKIKTQRLRVTITPTSMNSYHLTIHL